MNDIYLFPEKEIRADFSKCMNSTLREMTGCSVSTVSSFYKYNKTDDDLHLSFSMLKERGGDCRDYSFLYDAIANTLNISSQTIAIKINNSISHRFTVWNQNDIYCIIDQRSYACFDLIND